MRPYRLIPVPQWLHGLRLDAFLAAVIPRLSRSKAARICRSAVSIEPPRPIKPALRVRHGDVVKLLRLDEGPRLAPVPTVVFVRGDLVIINKPAGLLVHPTATVWSATVTTQLAAGEVGPALRGGQPAHRLDRDTSGLLMVGLEAAALRTIKEGMRRGRVTKTYLAVVADPQMRWRVGQHASLDSPLGFDRSSRVKIKMGVGDLEAHTGVEVLDRRGVHALLACEISQGRQHQIRAHLALEATPIVGDRLYQMGDDFFLATLGQRDDGETLAARPFSRHALHAAKLSWELGALGHGSVTAATPTDFPLWPDCELPGS